MASVRLIRQRLTDYDKQVKAANEGYADSYEAYRAAVAAYNTKATSTPYVVGGETQYGLVPLSNGDYAPGSRYGANPNIGDYYLGGSRYVSSSSYLGAQPTAPTITEPRAPNLTNSDLRALKNPPQDAAGAAMVAAKGYTPISELPSENQAPSKNSAFNDPDKPEDLRERGILARTLAGQLG